MLDSLSSPEATPDAIGDMTIVPVGSATTRRRRHRIVRSSCCRRNGACFLGHPALGPGVLTVVAPPDVGQRFLELVATVSRGFELDPVVLGIVRVHVLDDAIFPDVIDASGSAALAFRLLDVTGIRAGWDVQPGDSVAAAVTSYVRAWHPDAVAITHRPHGRLTLCAPLHLAGRLEVPLLVA